MRVIIEGADGSGKSTLAQKLKEIYGDVDVVHMRGRDVMTFQFLYEILDKQSVIWDRHFISERIYSEFYNLPYRITTGQERVLAQKCIDQDIPILVCIPEQHKVMDCEDDDIKERHDSLVGAYREVSERLGLVPIDPFTTSLEDIVSLIEKHEWRV